MLIIAMPILMAIKKNKLKIIKIKIINIITKIKRNSILYNQGR